MADSVVDWIRQDLDEHPGDPEYETIVARLERDENGTLYLDARTLGWDTPERLFCAALLSEGPEAVARVLSRYHEMKDDYEASGELPAWMRPKATTSTTDTDDLDGENVMADDIILDRDVYNRVLELVSRIRTAPVRHAPHQVYTPHLFGKVYMDALYEDLRAADARTLRMMDAAICNLRDGITSDPVDLDDQ